ncbi:cytochrome b561 and DOMON domain-containing protein, partial [Tanacetum coccineum]
QGNEVTAPYSDLKRIHGILNAVGWGVLIPIGAMIARYLKHLGSFWFYAHSSIQLSGFIIGTSGIITGLILNDRIDINVAKHKALGLIVVTLACLQVCALFVRLILHQIFNIGTLGRLLIVLAAFNVFYGIHLANAGSEWNVTYGVFLGVIVTIASEVSSIGASQVKYSASVLKGDEGATSDGAEAESDPRKRSVYGDLPDKGENLGVKEQGAEIRAREGPSAPTGPRSDLRLSSRKK